MAYLNVIGSSSHGNGYIIATNTEKIIIELGVGWTDILSTLNYDLRDVRGCLVSHIHGDHSCSIPNALKFGLDVYSCSGVQSIYQDVRVLKKGIKTRIGGFLVQPIPLQHSVECYGFLVTHHEIGKIVFATDCVEFPYKIKNVNHFMIEANYSDDILIGNMCIGQESRSISGNHLEINNSIHALAQNMSSDLTNVVLLHLSDSNSNADEFKKKTQKELGIANVFIANKGLKISLDKYEF